MMIKKLEVKCIRNHLYIYRESNPEPDICNATRETTAVASTAQDIVYFLPPKPFYIEYKLEVKGHPYAHTEN